MVSDAGGRGRSHLFPKGPRQVLASSQGIDPASGAGRDLPGRQARRFQVCIPTFRLRGDVVVERHSGNGRQLCPCQCHWDLSWLRFGDTRIAVTDVDGMFVVERRGHFLFIETKGMDEPLTQGQRILLTALSRIKLWTVVILYGEKGGP